MAKKSKSKNSAGNTSNAKNIKALINQNKMVVQQNAEAEKRKREEQEAREQAKREREEAAAKQAEAKTVEADQVISPEGEVTTKTEKEPEKPKKDAKVESKKDLKAKRKADPERRTMKKRIKETMSELKKVSWPSFKDVIKKTGVVLAVVIFFGIVLWIFDIIGHMFYNILHGNSIFPLF